MRIKVKTLLGSIGPLKTIQTYLRGVEAVDLHSDENLQDAKCIVDNMIVDVMDYMQESYEASQLEAKKYKEDQLNQLKADKGIYI